MLSIVISFLISSAYPCAPAPPKNHDIVISEEEALIIWDGKMEHFLRRGAFQSDADDFGFLVPSPTKPQLKEVSDGILHKLADTTKAKRVIEEYWTFNFVPLVLYYFASSTYDGAPEKSILVEQIKVAGMDAAILKTEDSDALKKWLVQNNYPFEAELKDWAEHYIQKNWYITAFKIDKEGSPAVNIASRLIHMQFATTRPFFPYKEPVSSSSKPRTLRIFMLSKQPPSPQIGDGEMQWPGSVVYSKAGDYTSIFENTPLVSLVDKGDWLSELEDFSSPRPGTDDLWLDGNANPKTIVREPIVIRSKNIIPLPLDVLLVLGGVGFWLYRRLQNNRSTSTEP